MTNLKYRIGIDESVKLLNIAKSNGIKIIFDQYRCFYHNVELWYVWLWNYGITKITVVMNMDNVEKNDLCIVIGHLFQKCPAKKYIVIQTEDILQKKIYI